MCVSCEVISGRLYVITNIVLHVYGDQLVNSCLERCIEYNVYWLLLFQQAQIPAQSCKYGIGGKSCNDDGLAPIRGPRSIHCRPLNLRWSGVALLALARSRWEKTARQRR